MYPSISKIFAGLKIGLLPVLIAFGGKMYAQGLNVEKAVAEKKFSFIAQSVTPLRSATRTLSPAYYYLQVHNDTLVSFLPYFGSQYSMPSSTELIYGGYQFTAVAITYIHTKRRRRTEITTTAKPYYDKLNISISITENGWAEVYILSSGRDPISYYGKLTTIHD